MDIYNLVSFCGLFILMLIAWLLSANRKILNYRCIIWGVGLQLLFGLLVFHAPGSTKLFLWLNDSVVKLLNAATEGQKFLLPRLLERG